MHRSNIRIRISMALILCLLFFSLSGCTSGKEEASFSALNSTVTITAYGSGTSTGVKNATSVVTALSNQMDVNSDASELGKLNTAMGKETVVPGQFVDIITTAKEIYERSNGALDLTVYPLIELWGFNNGSYNKPSQDEIDSALANLSFDSVQTNYYSDSGSYTVTMPALTKICLNCAASGYAFNAAIDQLQD